MHTLIHQTQFIKHYFDKGLQLYRYNYLPESEDMSEDEFKSFIMDMARITEQYKPLILLGDRRACKFVMTPEMQEWAAFTIGEIWTKIGIQKYAQILASDLFAQISGEQILDDAIEKVQVTYLIKTFDSEEKAINWLIE